MEYSVNSITSVNAMYIGVVNTIAFISTLVMLPAATTGQIEMKAVLAAVMGAQSASAYGPKVDYLQGYIHGAMDGKDSCKHSEGCH